MTRIQKLLFLLFLLGLSPLARANTLEVPGQFATIQAAVNAAVSGDEIVISAGIHDRFQISGKDGLVLRGKGKVWIEPLTPGVGIEIKNCNGIVLEKLRVRLIADVGISTFQSSDILIKKCTVLRTQGNGIQLGASEFVRVEKCKVLGSGAVGISLGSSDCLVKKNTISGCAGNGIAVSGSRNRVEDNRVDNVEKGIYLGLCTESIIAGNRMVDTRDDALMLNVSSRNHLLANRSDHSEADGINVQNSDDCVLSDNVIRRAAVSGIRLTGCARSRVRGNRTDRAGTGIYSGGSDDSALSDNVVRRSKGVGIKLSSSLRNHLHGNQVRLSGSYGIHLVLGQDHVLAGNVSKQNQSSDLKNSNCTGVLYVDNRFKNWSP